MNRLHVNSTSCVGPTGRGINTTKITLNNLQTGWAVGHRGCRSNRWQGAPCGCRGFRETLEDGTSGITGGEVTNEGAKGPSQAVELVSQI